VGWQLSHGGTYDANVAALKKRGAPIPKHMHPPKIMPGYDRWNIAFWELSTERHISGGPIPSSAIYAWPIPDHERDLFYRCIRAMDRVMLAHYAPKKDEETKGVPAGQVRPGMLKAMFGDKKNG